MFLSDAVVEIKNEITDDFCSGSDGKLDESTEFLEIKKEEVKEELSDDEFSDNLSVSHIEEENDFSKERSESCMQEVSDNPPAYSYSPEINRSSSVSKSNENSCSNAKLISQHLNPIVLLTKIHCPQLFLMSSGKRKASSDDSKGMETDCVDLTDKNKKRCVQRCDNITVSDENQKMIDENACNNKPSNDCKIVSKTVNGKNVSRNKKHKRNDHKIVSEIVNATKVSKNALSRNRKRPRNGDKTNSETVNGKSVSQNTVSLNREHSRNDGIVIIDVDNYHIGNFLIIFFSS